MIGLSLYILMLTQYNRFIIYMIKTEVQMRIVWKQYSSTK